MVKRVSSKTDARKKYIFITQKGTALFLQIKPLMLKSIESFQEGIETQEKEIFIKVMKKIQANLHKKLN